MNSHLYKCINKTKGRTFGIAHVGAHIGQEIPIYEKFEIKPILLFEPQLDVFNILRDKFSERKNIYFYNFGLGSNSTKKKLYKADSNLGASSSILKPLLHKEIHEEITFSETEEINIFRYDEIKVEKINFLVMDIQGFELEALKGFGKKLEEIEFIYTEVNRDFLYEENVIYTELDGFLKKNGFIRVSTRWDSRVPYGDAFYMRNTNLSNVFQYFNSIKNNFLGTSIYFMLLKIFDLKKNYVLLKKIIKKIVLRK